MSAPDAVIVGSGPNGLSAAVALAKGGKSVLVLEAADTIGGGTRSAALTLPGFVHDVCSAVHPLGILSPYLRTLGLEAHGLKWKQSPVSVAHPLDDEPAVILRTPVDETASGLGPDGPAYRRMIGPLLEDPHGLLGDILAPLRWPKHPIAMARFGLLGVRSAVGLAGRFEGQRARALLGGCAAHGIQPLEAPLTGAFGLMFLLAAHVEPWPVAEGGSSAIASALGGLLASLGGRIEVGTKVQRLEDLPAARVYLFDTDPLQLASIAEPVLPAGYVRRIRRYRMGPGVFKIDWALDGPIPWRDPEVGQASTVHLGGTIEALAASERAMWKGEHSDRPFVLLCQQSQLDPSRAPKGKHTGYAYVHVPAGSDRDLTAIVEAQVERFAPGFKDRILARHTTTATAFATANPNFIGGAITGGIADLGQLFTRPVARLDPYSTPNPRLFICSASTPPGGGVHGMCGYWAARSALAQIDRFPATPLL